MPIDPRKSKTAKNKGAVSIVLVISCLYIPFFDPVIASSSSSHSLSEFLVEVGYRRSIFEGDTGDTFLSSNSRRTFANDESESGQIARVYNKSFLDIFDSMNPACMKPRDFDHRMICDIASLRPVELKKPIDIFKWFLSLSQMKDSRTAVNYIKQSGFSEKLLPLPNEHLNSYLDRMNLQLCRAGKDNDTLCRDVLKNNLSIATLYSYYTVTSDQTIPALRHEALINMLTMSYSNSDIKNFRLATDIATKHLEMN